MEAETKLIDSDSRLSQTREVFVCHSADPLVGVVKVDQQELGMTLQLFFMFFGLCLKTQEIHRCFTQWYFAP